MVIPHMEAEEAISSTILGHHGVYSVFEVGVLLLGAARLAGAD